MHAFRRMSTPLSRGLKTLSSAPRSNFSRAGLLFATAAAMTLSVSGALASQTTCDAVDPNKFGEKESEQKISDREAKELARKKHNGELFD